MLRKRAVALTAFSLLPMFAGVALVISRSSQRPLYQTPLANATEGRSLDDRKSGHAIQLSEVTSTSATTSINPHNKCLAGAVALADVNVSTAPVSTDERIYRAVLLRNVTSGDDLENLTQEEQQELSRTLGLGLDVTSRVFKLYDSYVKSPHWCEYALLRDPGSCSAAVDGALIVVISTPSSAVARKDIRKWYCESDFGASYRLLFLVGQARSPTEYGALSSEARRHSDLIWVDIREDYNNLTLKTLAMLRWTMRHCSTAKFLVKIDDDVFVNATNLDAFLHKSEDRKRMLAGSVSISDGVFRNMAYKWYMPYYMYDKDTYPPFAHGPCYVLTTDMIADIIEVSMTAKFMHLEDIFVASCVNRLNGTSVVDVEHFISRDCAMRHAVAFHGVWCK